MMPAAPNFKQEGSISLFYSQTSLRHLATEFRNPSTPLEMWLTVDFDLTPEPEKLALVITESGEPGTLDSLIDRLNTSKKVGQRILQAFRRHGVASASGMVAVYDQAYDGRFRGTQFLKFLDTVPLD